MRKIVLVLTLASLFVLTCAGAAFADQSGVYNHYNTGAGNAPTDRTMTITASNCVECHADSVGHTGGPHGGYTSTTDKCQACHDVHAKGENPALLMGATLTAACQYCHDLTATWAGPYNMYGLAGVGAAHRVVGIEVYSYIDSEGTNNEPLGVGLYDNDDIPGANKDDGSSGGYNGIFNLTTGKNAILSDIYFTCNSCHTPHGVLTVNKYLGESPVKYANYSGEKRIYLTNRILRQRPNQTLANLRGEGTVPAAVYEFNSNWCLGCHAGRDTLAFETTHNHPVDQDAPGYRLVELALLKSGEINSNAGNGNYAWTSQSAFYADIKDGDFGRNYITFGDDTKDFDNDPRTNQQFALTPGSFVDNNAAREDGFDPLDRYAGGQPVYIDKGPACQQCHGSARDVEKAWVFNTDDLSKGNPNRTSFPHVSENKAFLSEKNGDDFCTNCHDPNILP